MRLTKYTHACVRLERAGLALVIDPGVFSEREAYDGASAILRLCNGRQACARSLVNLLARNIGWKGRRAYRACVDDQR